MSERHSAEDHSPQLDLFFSNEQTNRAAVSLQEPPGIDSAVGDGATSSDEPGLPDSDLATQHDMSAPEGPEPTIQDVPSDPLPSSKQLEISQARCTAPWQVESDGDEKAILLVVDARSIVEQCWHAPKLRERRTRENMECGIVHGFTRALLRLLWTFKPTHCAVYLDDCAWLSRRAIHAGYKPAEKAPSYTEQLPVCYEIAEALGCFTGARWATSFDVEACDAAATTISNAPANWHVVLSTTDSRLLQVANRAGLVQVTHWQNGEQETEEAEALCRRRLRVEPHQVADFLSIVGDHGDGIPGVKGLGEVAARALLAHFQSLEAIVAVASSGHSEASIASVPGLRGAARVAKMLREGVDTAVISFKLVELARDLELIPQQESWSVVLRRRHYEYPTLRRLCSDFEVPALQDLLSERLS